MEWYTELEQLYIHLFECVEGKNGVRVPVRGIECDKGWKRHVVDFLEALHWHTTHNCKDDVNNTIQIFQIKEKFGMVRAYVSAPDHIYSMIEKEIARLEGKCTLTCQNCGALEYDMIDTSHGWVTCLCTSCKRKE